MKLKFFNSIEQVETITRLRRHSKYSSMTLGNFIITVVSVYNVLDIDDAKLEAIKHDIILIIDA